MILGHEKNELILANAIAANHVFPTWVFSGAYGIGKASMAYKFAKCLLSGHIPTDGTLNIPEDDPTDKLVGNRTHPDLIVLEQTNETVSIDDVRILFSKLHLSPTKSKWRAVILENASAFNKNVSNSLLKILEEPPERTVIILICTTLGNLPKTLLSRAMKLHFSSLPIDTVQRFLEKRGIPNAENLAKISNGSIGLALKMHENLGLETYQYLLDGFQNRKVQNALKFIKDNEIDFGIVRECFLHILHEYVHSIINREDSVRCSFEIEKIQQIISLINHCEVYMLDKNAVIAASYEKFFN